MTIIRFILGAIVGFVLAQIVLGIQTAICSVPLLNVTTCFGLGAPAPWEQLLLTLGMPIIAGRSAIADA